MQAQQGRRTRTPSLGGTSSLYSYASTTRTVSRSMKSLKVAWYKKPLVQDAIFTDIQTGALLTAIFCIVRIMLFTHYNTNIVILLILDRQPLHDFNCHPRHILFGNNSTRCCALWILHNEFPVCLCRECPRSQLPDSVCSFFSNSCCCTFHNKLHAVESSPKRTRKKHDSMALCFSNILYLANHCYYICLNC